MKLSSKILNTEKKYEDPYYIYILIFYSYIMKTTYNIALWLLPSVLFLVTINTHIPFKLNPPLSLNFIQNIIIISIYYTKIYLCMDFYPLNTVTNSLRDILDISYYKNIETWMDNCECWNYDSLLQWLLFPISISFSLHGENIFSLDK